MRNDWSEIEAKKYINKYKKLGHSKDMALRVYTTRLLGRNSELVLHGGGNTSVKTEIKDIDKADKDQQATDQGYAQHAPVHERPGAGESPVTENNHHDECED